MRIGLFYSLTMKSKGLQQMNMFELLCWLAIFLLLGGDVHQNPGPDDSFDMFSSSTGTSFSSSISDAFAHNLKIVHYNVQSFLAKKDILYADLNNFDIIVLLKLSSAQQLTLPTYFSLPIIRRLDAIDVTIHMEEF
ncbi:hypothetical protein DPMN_013308 [Dreissena polymorpha]|uniref:Uncharacterized protein n=1 Tax=Dreissena polymorpha TaxID=45954 RepID=A0A9D4N7J5_DREPO|nr:hypothetical protein DPMN_013308 [Dreissena polymorpha]